MKVAWPMKKVVEIVWDDAWYNSGPKEISDIDPTPMEVFTTGYLVMESSSCVVVASEEFAEDGRLKNIHCIPKILIKKRRVIRAK